MLIYTYMKNTLFAMFIAIFGMFGAFSAASAQVIPANAGSLNPNAGLITAAPVTTNYASKYKMISNAVVAPQVTASVTAPTNPTINATQSPIVIDTNLIVPVSSSSIDTLINTAVLSPITVTNPIVTTNTNPVVTQTGTPSTQTPNPVQPVQPVTTSGVVVVTSGQYLGTGMYGTYVAPTTATVAQPAAQTTATRTTYSSTPKKAVVAKEPIPLLEEEPQTDDEYSRNDYAASAFGISSGVTLIGLLALIAVGLGIMVGVQEYKAKKREEEAMSQMYA